MNPGIRTIAVLRLAWTLTALVRASPVRALECGDVDDSGVVGASDALMVLRKAVGLTTSPLQCPGQCVTTTTTSTTTNTSGGECHGDWDCEAYVGEGYVCGGADGYTCVDCQNDDAQCEEGFVCNGDFQCVPAPQ